MTGGAVMAQKKTAKKKAVRKGASKKKPARRCGGRKM